MKGIFAYGLFESELHLCAYDDEHFFGMGENSTGHSCL